MVTVAMLATLPTLTGRLLLRLFVLVAMTAAYGQEPKPAAGDPGIPYEGKKIKEILFEPHEQPVGRDQLGISLRIRPGDPFNSKNLSDAIERLYITGRFEDIEVQLSPSDEGVTLLFRTQPRWFVGRVSVAGVPEPPNQAQLVNATKIDPGTEFREDELPLAATRLNDTLRANGFYGGKVRWATNRNPRGNQTEIRFLVEVGPRAKFTRPVFTGELKQKEDRLIKATLWPRWYGLRGWKEFTDARMQRGLDRLRQLYLNRDFLGATVRVTNLEYDAQRNVVIPHLDINPGGRVQVIAEGAKLSRGTLRANVPIYQERTVDQELLREGRNNLQEYFQAQGYFDAKVDILGVNNNSPDNVIITYRVNRGSRYKLVFIGIDGNSYLSDETLRDSMNTIPGGTIRFRRGRFSREMIASDAQSIEEMYRANGFRDAEVKTRIETSYKGKPRELAIFFDVKEGPQWFVSDVEVSGVDLNLYPQILELISSSKGQPYNPGGVVSDRDAILNFYFNSGYPEATLDYTVAENEAEHRVSVSFTVREGRRNFIREIIVSGLSMTKPELVTSRLTFGPGDPLSQARLVETQRRLYDLGIFAKVDVAVQNPEGRERNKYVLLQMDEAKKYSLTLGFGAEFGRLGGGNSLTAPAGATGFSPRALVGITRLNFLGIGHTVGLTGRVSNYQRRLLFTYTAPQFRGNEKYSLQFTQLYDYSRDVRTYTAVRYESGAQLVQRIDRANTFQYRLTFRLVDIPEDTLNIDPSLIPIYSQPVRVGSVSTSYIRDRRDDPLDSTRGSFLTLDGGLATRWLGSDTQYTRVVARQSTYHKISRDIIFARTTTFGWLYNYGPDPIPLPEKFYAGGSSTHRGFPDNQAGPRDLVTGFPIGGDAFLLNGLELRFPLIGNSVGGVLFHDAGNVYSALDKISFRYNQRDLEDFDYMVHAVGLGFRFKTPIGPVRVDFAYGLNSPQFLGFEGTREDLINGNGGQQILTRVRPFQFHFSLGQTF